MPSQTALSEVKAFKTWLCGVSTIVFAETAGKAKSATLQAARSANFDYVFFTDVKCRRAPKYDKRRYWNGDIATIGDCHFPDKLMSDEPINIAQAKEQQVSL